MLTLAIDHSTAAICMALLRDDTPSASRRWVADREHAGRLWGEFRLLFEECGARPDAVDCFAVGLGPGVYSGLRVSLMAIRGMAMPGVKPVLGISSGEAIAARAFRAGQHDTAVVIGDARRGRLWAGVFSRGGQWPVMTVPYRLILPAELASLTPPGTILLSPDPARTRPMTDDLLLDGVVRVQTPALPDAEDIGLLALARIRAGIIPAPSDPLRPIYLHPPVFVAPRAACQRAVKNGLAAESDFNQAVGVDARRVFG